MLNMWLCFGALLRAGEADALQVGDLCFPEEVELITGVTLAVGVRQPKTKRTSAVGGNTSGSIFKQPLFNASSFSSVLE